MPGHDRRHVRLWFMPGVWADLGAATRLVGAAASSAGRAGRLPRYRQHRTVAALPATRDLRQQAIDDVLNYVESGLGVRLDRQTVVRKLSRVVLA